MRAFRLPAPAFSSVVIRKEWSMYARKETLTDEELTDVLVGKDLCISTHSEDHAEFTELRELLGAQGFIYIERGWWNGDRVLRPFSLNRKRFKRGDKFVSAGAMKFSLRHFLK